MFADLIAGFSMPMTAFSTIRKNPKLWKAVAIPLLINMIIFGGGFSLLWVYRSDVVNMIWAYPSESSILAALWYVLAVLIFLFAALLAYFLFTPIGCLIASPFNNWLSHSSEGIIDAELPEEEVPFTLGDIILTLRRELGKLIVMGLILFVGALLNLIPGPGSILSVGWTLVFGGWFLSIEYLDYPMSRYGYSFSELVGTTRSHFYLSLGFGLGAMLLLVIPLLNLVCIPVCVVGATALYVELHRKRQLPPPAQKEN